MSTSDIKQSTIEIALRLLNGAYALPVIIVGIVYFWSHLSLEQIDRIKQLEPLLNSSLGIAFAVIIVVSYLSNVVSSPIKEMTEAVIALKGDLHGIIEAMERRLDKAEMQHISIVEEVKEIKKFFETR
jgi:hypothetical protein